MSKVILGVFITALSSLSAFAGCPDKMESIKVIAGSTLPVGDCSSSLYHSNGKQAFYQNSGSWYASNGTQVYYPNSRSIFYPSGSQAYYPNLGSWFHSNGTQAYYPNSGSWFHDNGTQAYYPNSGSLYYSNGTKAGTYPSVQESDMLKFVEITH